MIRRHRRALAAAAVGATSLLVATLLSASSAVAATENPLIGDGSVYSADPTLLVADDTLYLHAGRDEAGPTTNDFIMNEWQAFSTADPDAGDWEHHPSVMRPEDVFDWASPGRAYAGQVVEGADGRFYWYVPVHEAASTSPDKFGIGVAVSDTPLGPWSDHAGGPIVSQKILGNDAHNIDPTVFVDDDGKVWMYWGSFGRLMAIQLGADMKTLIGTPTSITSGVTGFFEAAWLFRRDDTYYLAYAANNAGPDSTCTPANYHACIAYSTASSPLGPWTYRGPILAPVSSTTSHPAIAEFQGKWYIAYHTADAVGGNHFRRSVAIDVLEWDDTRTPARIRPVVTTPERGVDHTPRTNIAPWATASASNQPIPTQYWIKALNDEIVRPNPLPPDMWGSWSSTRPAQQWIQYDWQRPVRVDSARIKFWRDVAPGTGDGVSDPASWVLQYWDAGVWKNVPEPSGYPTTTTRMHEVTFAPVTTSRLRAVLNASPNAATPAAYSAVAVEEWEVHAARADAIAPVSRSTTVGVQPALPDAVALTFGEDEILAPVHWDEIAAGDLAEAGEITVAGFAEGYAAGRATATITVREQEDPGTPDGEAPRVTLEALGTPGGSGWFVSPVTVRATASDDRDVRMRIETATGTAGWTATEDSHRVDAVVTAEGVTAVRARATDAAGNVSEEATTEVRIDATAPQVTGAFDAPARTVTATASDAGSGIAVIEYAVDSTSSWQTYASPVALDGARHVVHLRARDVAGNVSALSSTAVPLSPDAPLEGNIAPLATATASFTSGWNSTTAVNDESLTGASWGTWPNVGEQWVQLAWDRRVTIDRAGVLFFRDQPDTAGAGMIPPREWRLQYFDDATASWKDVAADAAPGRSSETVNEVSFSPVTTTRVRALMQSWGAASGGGSAGILEFQVWAAQETEPLDASIAITSRCVAGAVVLVATATNAEATPMEFALVTSYGEKSLTAKAGASASTSLSTRLAEVPAGTVTATATATVDGDPVTRALTADHPARSCR